MTTSCCFGNKDTLTPLAFRPPGISRTILYVKYRLRKVEYDEDLAERQGRVLKRPASQKDAERAARRERIQELCAHLETTLEYFVSRCSLQSRWIHGEPQTDVSPSAWKMWHFEIVDRKDVDGVEASPAKPSAA